MSIIGPFQVIGLEDIAKKPQPHQSTVTCLSDHALVLRLSSENFFGFLYRHIAKDSLSELFQQRVPFYNTRVESVLTVHSSQRGSPGPRSSSVNENEAPTSSAKKVLAPTEIK